MHSKGSVMLDLSRHEALLGQSDLFRDMPPALIRHVATHAVERLIRDKDALYLKRDALDFFALVIEGRLYSVIQGPDGREQIVGSSEAGAVIGESALIAGHCREASAFACGPTRVLLVGRRHFDPLCAEPLFLSRVLMLVMVRLLQSMELLEMVCLHRLETRLARFLLANINERDQTLATPPCVLMPASQSVLAAMLNTSRPRLNVQLQSWRRLGLISGRADRIVINDVDHLRRKAYAQN